MATLERRLENCRKTSYFMQFARDRTSQGGEDGIIEKIFQLLHGDMEAYDSVDGGYKYCVDIGAWDGVHISNTYTLFKEERWRGLLFEADPDRWKSLHELYADRPKEIKTFCKLVGFSGVDSLRYLLWKQNSPFEFDFLSIDVDGADYYLWESLSADWAKYVNISAVSNAPEDRMEMPAYYPRVVCIEFNPSIPNEVVFVQEKSIHVQQGSSLRALKELGSRLGYTLVATTTFNAFFVRNDYMTRLPDFDNSLHALHSTTMITSFFQTYDGEIKLLGPKKLLWSRIPINPQNVQVIKKKADRKFPFSPTNAPKIDELNKIVVETVETYVKLMKNFKELWDDMTDSNPTISFIAIEDEDMLSRCSYLYNYLLHKLFVLSYEFLQINYFEFIVFEMLQLIQHMFTISDFRMLISLEDILHDPSALNGTAATLEKRPPEELFYEREKWLFTRNIEKLIVLPKSLQGYSICNLNTRHVELASYQASMKDPCNFVVFHHFVLSSFAYLVSISCHGGGGDFNHHDHVHGINSGAHNNTNTETLLKHTIETLSECLTDDCSLLCQYGNPTSHEVQMGYSDILFENATNQKKGFYSDSGSNIFSLLMGVNWNVTTDEVTLYSKVFLVYIDTIVKLCRIILNNRENYAECLYWLKNNKIVEFHRLIRLGSEFPAILQSVLKFCYIQLQKEMDEVYKIRKNNSISLVYSIPWHDRPPIHYGNFEHPPSQSGTNGVTASSDLTTSNSSNGKKTNHSTSSSSARKEAQNSSPHDSHESNAKTDKLHNKHEVRKGVVDWISLRHKKLLSLLDSDVKESNVDDKVSVQLSKVASPVVSLKTNISPDSSSSPTSSLRSYTSYVVAGRASNTSKEDSKTMFWYSVALGTLSVSTILLAASLIVVTKSKGKS